jgi:hypothetical protein
MSNYCDRYTYVWYSYGGIQTTGFRDVTPCTLVDMYQYFGGRCNLHLSPQNLVPIYQSTRRHNSEDLV